MRATAVVALLLHALPGAHGAAGVGGVVWDGAVVLAQLIERNELPGVAGGVEGKRVVELGSGTGADAFGGADLAWAALVGWVILPPKFHGGAVDVPTVDEMPTECQRLMLQLRDTKAGQHVCPARIHDQPKFSVSQVAPACPSSWGPGRWTTKASGAARKVMLRAKSS